MTESEFIARAEQATRWADLEKLLYERGSGISRSDCKALVGKLKKLTQHDNRARLKAQAVVELKQSFWRQLAS